MCGDQPGVTVPQNPHSSIGFSRFCTVVVIGPGLGPGRVWLLTVSHTEGQSGEQLVTFSAGVASKITC